MTWPTFAVKARFDKSAMTLTDISDYVRRITIKTGRSRFLDRYNPGTISLVLDDHDGRFTATNLSGPYVSGGETQIEPMVQLLVQATHSAVTRNLKIAFADSWETLPSDPEDALCTVQATDGFKVLANADPGETAPGGFNVGNTMLQVLPTSSYLAGAGIDTSSPQPTVPVFAVTTEKSLALLQSLADSDRGDLFMAPESVGGNVVDSVQFRPYYLRQTGAVVAVWSDNPGVGEFLYETVRPIRTDDVTFITQVTGQRSGGTAVTVTDATALTKNMGIDKPRSNTSLLLATDPEVEAWAAGVLYRFKVFDTGFARMTVDVSAQDDDDTWGQVLDHQIGDRITIARNGTSRDHFIEGIEYSIAHPAGGAVQVTFLLSDASRFFTDVFILDSVTNGVLDTNRLGF